jgi:hypothetical protein
MVVLDALQIFFHVDDKRHGGHPRVCPMSITLQHIGVASTSHGYGTYAANSKARAYEYGVRLVFIDDGSDASTFFPAVYFPDALLATLYASLNPFEVPGFRGAVKPSHSEKKTTPGDHQAAGMCPVGRTISPTTALATCRLSFCVEREDSRTLLLYA